MKTEVNFYDGDKLYTLIYNREEECFEYGGVTHHYYVGMRICEVVALKDNHPIEDKREYYAKELHRLCHVHFGADL